MVTKKVWCPTIEPEPEGLFNKGTCPDAPKNWFREEPAVAAELYALELGGGRGHYTTKYEIRVLDEGGTYHRFQTETCRELVALVRLFP